MFFTIYKGQVLRPDTKISFNARLDPADSFDKMKEGLVSVNPPSPFNIIKGLRIEKVYLALLSILHFMTKNYFCSPELANIDHVQFTLKTEACL